jgi:hypothetical protein
MIIIKEYTLQPLEYVWQNIQMPQGSEILKTGFLNLLENTSVIILPMFVKIDTDKPLVRRGIYCIKSNMEIYQNNIGTYIDSLTYNNESYHVFDCGEE